MHKLVKIHLHSCLSIGIEAQKITHSVKINVVLKSLSISFDILLSDSLHYTMRRICLIVPLMFLTLNEKHVSDVISNWVKGRQ